MMVGTGIAQYDHKTGVPMTPAALIQINASEGIGHD
jgi:hypothetical protein